jgi:Ca2+-binding EF-hand superfamily protein
MKAVLLISAAALAATPVLAQPATAANPPKPMAKADFVKTLNTHFAQMDTNHDGKLSRDEIVAAQQHDVAAAKAQLAKAAQAAFQKLDTNKDGKLSLEEYMASIPQVRPTATPEQILQQLDTNHDGKISTEEFDAPRLAAFNKADTNHDGVLSPQEQLAAEGRK